MRRYTVHSPATNITEAYDQANQAFPRALALIDAGDDAVSVTELRADERKRVYEAAAIRDLVTEVKRGDFDAPA